MVKESVSEEVTLAFCPLPEWKLAFPQVVLSQRMTFKLKISPRKQKKRHLTIEVVRQLLAANYFKSLLRRAKNMRKIVHIILETE